jgi:hypothetical protein
MAAWFGKDKKAYEEEDQVIELTEVVESPPQTPQPAPDFFMKPEPIQYSPAEETFQFDMEEKTTAPPPFNPKEALTAAYPREEWETLIRQEVMMIVREMAPPIIRRVAREAVESEIKALKEAGETE